MSSLLFTLFSGICILSSIFVILSKNPIFSVLFLILCFCNVSCILFLFNFEFLPISFLVIYVGAIAVLFLFIIMMINLKLAELSENQTQFWPLIIFLCCLFVFEMLTLFRLEFPFIQIYDQSSSIFLLDFLTNFNANFNYINSMFYFSNIKMIAYALFNNYLYCFLFSGFVLLLAMVGAIVLTLQKQFVTKTQNVYIQILKDFNNTIVHYS
jgi:NADH:ubiquinone oxidoreductase subunit 6 (subunit J)